VGHTLEYSRVAGIHAGFASVHIYMGPVGVVLVGLAVVGMVSTARLGARLERRLTELRGGLARGSTTSVPGWTLSFPGLLAALWLWQCGLYLAQENLEALWLRRSVPGWGAMTGTHAWAALIHLLVAGVIAGSVWLGRRRVSALGAAVEAEELRLAAAWAVGAPADIPRAARTWTPSERWGMQLWSRPPPVAA
jgi:hypothetical protein